MDDLPALWRLGISASGDVVAAEVPRAHVGQPGGPGRPGHEQPGRTLEGAQHEDLLYREADARLYAAKAERGRVVA